MPIHAHMYMSVNLIAFYRCCNEDRDVLSKQSNKYCISLELCDGPRVQFLMPLSFPQEFLNWICTCSLSLRRCSIRFLDDWWTRFIGSQLLYSQRDNWITLWGNWLLCYGMHHGKLSNLPGAQKTSSKLRSDIMLLWWKVWWLWLSLQEMTLFPH